MPRSALITLAWILLAINFGGVMWGVYSVVTDRSGSYLKGVAVGLVMFLLLLVAVAGGLVAFFSTRQTQTGLWVMVCVLVWPPLALIGSTLTTAGKNFTAKREEARIGAFDTPALTQLADALRAKDHAAFEKVLSSHPDLKGKDAAGNDILAYACILARDGGGDVEPIRLLLEAGMKPDASKLPPGEALVNYMILSSAPKAQEIVRLLLEHGADPNTVYNDESPLRDAFHDVKTIEALIEHGADKNQLTKDGTPVIVGYVVNRAWDAAIYMVEHGARLDGKSELGVDLDYYLKEWSQGTYGEAPEGLQRLRAALEARNK